jgi:hypothetical protein
MVLEFPDIPVYLAGFSVIVAVDDEDDEDLPVVFLVFIIAKFVKRFLFRLIELVLFPSLV